MATTTDLAAATRPTPGEDRAIHVQDATPAQVRQWLESGQAVLIDVREPDEHAREKIVGAALMPLSRFDPASAASKAAPGQRLVFHCRSGRRAAEACRMAGAAAGQTPVANMAGGIEAWKQANLPVQVDTRAPAMSIMRQVQLVVGVGVLIGAALAWWVHPGFVIIPAFLGAGLAFAGATGTCGLAAVLSRMPWNRGAPAAASCSTSGCG
jgi:rhodanese-related sulfurtransferase